MAIRFLTDADQAHMLFSSAQELTTDQQTQARSNIGAAASEDVPQDVLSYQAQALTADQQTQARSNIGAAASEDIPQNVLRYTYQYLNTAQKAQVIKNIGAMAVPQASVGQAIIVRETDVLGMPSKWIGASYPYSEEWTFTLEDGSTVTKKVAVFS